MTKRLRSRGIGIFGYPAFAGELRNRVRAPAATIAAVAGVTIEHLAKSHLRKEAVVGKILAACGDQPGLVHVISVVGACEAYQPWHEKQTHRTFLRPDRRYYFYFIDAELGLIYLRVPTWLSVPARPAAAVLTAPESRSASVSINRSHSAPAFISPMITSLSRLS